MKKITFLLCAFLSISMFSQFTTAGDGTTYTLSSLSSAAPTVLVNNGTYYTMTNDITISPTDILDMNENTTLKIDADKTLFVYGEYKTSTDNLLITATNTETPFKGIRFEDGSKAEIKNTRIEYGGGIRVLGDNFVMDNCILYKNVGGISTGGAISFSKGKPIVKNSQFIENERAAINSAANATVSGLFINNYLYKNVQNNANTPQINMGPSGADSLKIINNTIIGDRTKIKAGGISASSLTGGVNKFLIEGNTVRDNRYGITSYGANSSGRIVNNIIEDNNTENIPANGGSGISLYNAQNVIIKDNKIRNNLWGITTLGTATVNLGSIAAPGNNIFKNNKNEGVTYAFYNNTPNDVSAVGNCWREDELSDDGMVEAVIFGKNFDNALGLITYKPYNCAILATTEIADRKSKIYPNPSNGMFFVETLDAGNYIITDFTGKLLTTGFLNKGKNNLSLKLASGTYIIVLQSNGKRVSDKLIIK